MSLAEHVEEQESLIYPTNHRLAHRADSVHSVGTSPSPQSLSRSESQEKQKGGLFAKLKSRTRHYSLVKVRVMSDSHSAHPTISNAQSVPIPSATKLKGGSSSSSSTISHTPVPDQSIDINYDQIVAEIEAPGSPFHANYTSKDDLDLLCRKYPPLSRSSSHHEQPPRATASAVNPISVPHHTSHRQITLDTDFPVTQLLQHRVRRSNSHNETDTVPPHESPARTHDVDEEDESVDPIDPEITLKFIDDAAESPTLGVHDPMDDKLSYDLDSEQKDDLHEESNSRKRVSMKDILAKKPSKQSVLAAVSIGSDSNPNRKRKEKRQKMKKEKSNFLRFQKEKKPDLSDNKNLPIRLKELLNEESTNPFFTYTLRYIEDLDDKTKAFMYEQLVNDKEFIPLICNKLLDATDAKHSEMVCIMLYDFMKEDDPNARLFAVQFIPCLVWCAMTRPPRSVSGVVAVLLSLYKKEAHIFEKLYHSSMDEQAAAVDEAKELLDSLAPSGASSSNFGVSNHHEIFPKFEMPDLDLPSVYHEPGNYKPAGTSSSKNGQHKNGKNTHSNSSRTKGGLASVAEESPGAASKGNKESTKEVEMEKNKLRRKKEWKERKEALFPSLNQANVSTNLHLIFVALQVFNHYITRVSKPSLCLEQINCVIAKLCFSGLYANQTLKWPEGVTFAWDWRWYTEDLKDKQHEKYILPSAIISQFLYAVRYSLKQPATRKIAQFALGQVHKRGHIDMMPEIILQTTSMLHPAFMAGLTF